MKLLKFIPAFLLILLPIQAHALVIKDVISVNKILEIDWRSYDFDITKHGYNHLTDTINSVTLTYDFSNMLDEGDDFDNYDTLETIQLNSYIFDGRTNFHDINPGFLTQITTWTKDESYCQKEDYDIGECEFNLDLYGTAREFLSVYNGNIWLNDVTFSVDVTRVYASEPSALILLFLGLLILYFCYQVKIKNYLVNNKLLTAGDNYVKNVDSTLSIFWRSLSGSNRFLYSDTECSSRNDHAI